MRILLVFVSVIILFQLVFGITFYYNTQNNKLNKKVFVKSLTDELFVFLPGTSASCKYYTQLFITIQHYINILCINYPSSLKISINYYKHNSFLNRSQLLENSLVDALKIINKEGINFLDNTQEHPNWKKIRAGGHSQGGVIVAGWAKRYDLLRLIMFSSPGCQFGKRLHTWLKYPFATKHSKIYAIESLQDTILPWFYGNKFFNCKNDDGVSSYIHYIGITDKKIQLITYYNNLKNKCFYYIFKNTQVILLNLPFMDGVNAHLFTCFNINIKNNFRKNLWYHVILRN